MADLALTLAAYSPLALLIAVIVQAIWGARVRSPDCRSTRRGCVDD